MPDETYHLWRSFPTAPHWRWAFDIVKDADVDDGYRIIDYDQAVADGAMMHAFHDHMLRPALVRGLIDEDEGKGETMAFVYTGEPGHFESAVRTFDHLSIGATGRAV
jgi:hypothetical protein